MKSKIICQSHDELTGYLEELFTYFRTYGVIPLEEGEVVPLPTEGVVRIRFDSNRHGGSVKITVDWN